MPETFRVGVLGTLVKDRIYGAPPSTAWSEGWGGIAYALSGLDAALTANWEIVPLIKVGADVAADARAYLAGLRRVARDAELREVPEMNNRSELRYYSNAERVETMSGGVPPWTWEELEPILRDANLDALYVNFLSGVEVDLATMQRIRRAFAGPIYMDVHMMLWRPDDRGVRALTPLAHAERWCGCCDLVQVNEEEMRMLAPDADALADLALRAGASATLVTLGPRGVRYDTREGFRSLRVRRDLTSGNADGITSGITSATVPPPHVLDGDVDPTGCGDVWGATLFARLVAGDDLEIAVRRAHVAAGANAGWRGIPGLVAHLISAGR